ncbi:SRPBCC family protein [Pseudomonas sp. SZMC_28357]|uniref:SRPBCC family protein n=1 Tax=Pseudomonas sp. SZMC_28357 TaxID=3074380 RepID=UPI002871187B|nr:SRPBCC family protein [Pseudomonas sp. SZMC_28357]MDR9752505.1 SRPBCC family protein [Pseudomonas sp. SZMC_28357]
MINVSKRLEINPAGEVVLSRAQVWEGLEEKARNPIGYVRPIEHCKIVEEAPGGSPFIREVRLHGETLQELITLFPQERVEFVRISGGARGIIKNIIEEENGTLFLRFTFTFSLEGVQAGSAEEKAFAEGMETSYCEAVNTTLGRMRAKKNVA